jgi:hypothetical protein
MEGSSRAAYPARIPLELEKRNGRLIFSMYMRPSCRGSKPLGDAGIGEVVLLDKLHRASGSGLATVIVLVRRSG